MGKRRVPRGYLDVPSIFGVLHWTGPRAPPLPCCCGLAGLAIAVWSSHKREERPRQTAVIFMPCSGLSLCNSYVRYRQKSKNARTRIVSTIVCCRTLSLFSDTTPGAVAGGGARWVRSRDEHEARGATYDPIATHETRDEGRSSRLQGGLHPRTHSTTPHRPQSTGDNGAQVAGRIKTNTVTSTRGTRGT